MQHDRDILRPVAALAADLPVVASRLASVDGAGRLLKVLSWIGAASITTAMHVGIYWSVMRSTPEDMPTLPVAPAAMMIDMGAIAVAPQSIVDNEDRSPASVASDAAPEVKPDTPPPPPAPEEDLPNLAPTPPDAQSEAVLPEAAPKEPSPRAEVPPPKPDEPKPEPEKKVEKVPEKTESKPRPATKNSGGPRSQSNAQHARGGDPGWMAGVRAKISRAKLYPQEARSLNQTGSPMVAVTIGPSGNLVSVTLLVSSGSRALDAEAVAVMRRAAPYQPPPDGRPTTLRIPIAFTRR